MKKLLSLALVLTLMLSLGISAFAQIKVDGEPQDETSLEVPYAEYVSADASGDQLTVIEDVSDTTWIPDPAVKASGSSTITVNGSVSESVPLHNADAIYATGSNTSVSVGGDVTESGGGNAINAMKGAIVTVEGSVTESGNDNAITATEDALVIVIGDVTGNDAGSAIKASEDATVIVGGNVTGVTVADALVIVEGSIGDGEIRDNGELYVGQVNGTISSNAERLYYLVGLASDSECDFSDITMTEGTDIIDPSVMITGVEKEYLFTKTGNPLELKGKTVTLKPADGKALTVEGFDGAKVSYTANEDGTVSFTIVSGFNGGLQNLKLILSDKPGPGPDPDPTPVIYVVPVSTVKTVEFQAPEGFEEGLITKLNSADHAGLTIDKSLLAEGGEHSVKVTLDGKELPAEAYRFCINADGSLSLTLSNTYMFSLGDGTYDLVAVIDGLEIPFTVAVAK